MNSQYFLPKICVLSRECPLREGPLHICNLTGTCADKPFKKPPLATYETETILVIILHFICVN